VVTIDDPQDAVRLARALVEGGVRIIEIPLRTESAITSLKLIANGCPTTGTVLTLGQADAAVAAGAQFLVSPGVTPSCWATFPAVLRLLTHGEHVPAARAEASPPV
jgi:2-dehydro-3-deoxyphosphogluconate aldolase/(4S)-4-hydroxy-2-oxoglutarate aldolase